MNIHLLMLLIVKIQVMKTGAQLCTRGAIRLLNGNTPQASYGRVELCNANGEWGTVCDEEWDDTDARIVCRQLGFSGTAIACRSACFGEGIVNSRFKDFQCNGGEDRLIDCERTGSNCNHDRDAGVLCANETVSTVTQTVTPSNEVQCTVTVPTLCSATQEAECNPAQSCTVVSGALGALIGIMAVSLVAVITGWVWTCWTVKRKSTSTGGDITEDKCQSINAAYGITTKTSTHQYSAQREESIYEN